MSAASARRRRARRSRRPPREASRHSVRRGARAHPAPRRSGLRRRRSARSGYSLSKRLGSRPVSRGSPASGGIMNAERAVFVYTTFPSLVEAEKTGRAVLERRLAACVNILPGMISHYWWQGAIERGEEVVMIIKTRASLSDEVRGAV